MSCSIPLFDKLLHKLGYKPACILHDLDYEEAVRYTHKFLSDINLYKNMRKVKEWYSMPIGALTVFILSTNPFSYYLYFKNKHNSVGHTLTGVWLFISIYSIVNLMEWFNAN